MFSNIVNQLLYTKLERVKQRIWEVVTSENMRRLKMLARNLFEAMFDSNLYCLKFHLLDHILEHVSWFGDPIVLDEFPYELFIYGIKKFRKKLYLRRGSMLE